jgi:hypothetical protein
LPAKVQSESYVRYSGLLSDAIDEGLAALGQLPKDAIYEALKTNFSMQKKDIPARFAEFSNILRDNIGPSAEPLLGFIIDRFCREIRIESMSSIDLDESISRVHLIVKGALAAPAGIFMVPLIAGREPSRDLDVLSTRVADPHRTALERSVPEDEDDLLLLRGPQRRLGDQHPGRGRRTTGLIAAEKRDLDPHVRQDARVERVK